MKTKRNGGPSLSVTPVYSTFRPHGDTDPTDELDMSLADDENEESNITTFRALLSFSKVTLRLVSSDIVDRIVIGWDEDTRLSVLGRQWTVTMRAAMSCLHRKSFRVGMSLEVRLVRDVKITKGTPKG